jgi:hypothetical protein
MSNVECYPSLHCTSILRVNMYWSFLAALSKAHSGQQVGCDEADWWSGTASYCPIGG